MKLAHTRVSHQRFNTGVYTLNVAVVSGASQNSQTAAARL